MMYEIKRERYSSDYYYYRTKNKVGQTLYIDFQKTNDNVFEVLFFITTKRKHGYQHLKITGEDGITSLIWAKNCIKDFINDYPFIRNKENEIRIYASDKRRMKAYEFGLRDLGFKVSRTQTKYLSYGKE